MDCIVDAGVIVNVMGKSERDCALLAFTEAGDRAQFPIVVKNEATGETVVYVAGDELEKIPPSPAQTKPKEQTRRA